MTTTPSAESNRERTTGDSPESNEVSTGQAEPNTAAASERSASTGGERDQPAIGLDLIFDALSNSRRRQVLHYLRGNDEPVSISDLAERVAALENDTTVEQLHSQQRKRVYVGLYQCHLPRLDDMGIVTFDRDRGLVRLGPNAPRAYTYLPTDEDEPSRPWPLYHLGYATTSLVVYGLAVVGGIVTVAGWAALPAAILVGLFALSVAQVLDERSLPWLARPPTSVP